MQQKKITKTQAVQVNETDEGEGQINIVTLKRPVHQGSMEERCLQKEPFFINHYYSHPIGQCCCQQHAMSVKEGQITLQSSTLLNHEKSENSQKLQQLSEIKTCNNIMYPPTYNGMNEQGKRMLQDENRNPIVEPRIHLMQASVPDRINMEFQTDIKTDTKTPQKDRDLLKVVQMVAELLQQQIVLGVHTTDMSQQCTDALIGELIKSHNRRDMDNVLNNIPTFNRLEPERCVDRATRIRNVCEQSNRDFRQELMNESELMVQNFIKGLGADVSDDEVMNRILGFFSDIPTPYHAMDKIKSIKQNDEPMPQFNQKYRTYIECLERKTVNEMTSYTQMELYMSAINPHIAKALRTNIHYGSRYAATSVGDAMKKAEECYLKDLRTGWIRKRQRARKCR